MITTSMTSSGAPPTRTTNAIGETAWLIANEASGTPPNGHDHLRISASTIEPGSTTHRQRLAGAIAQATPNQTEEIREATTQPGAVRNTIQPMPGKSHAAATAHPRQNRLRAGRPARRRSRKTTPTISSGHHPQGEARAP